MDSELHIGPYLVVTGEKEYFIDKKIRTCSNKKCETHKKLNLSCTKNFCSECGSKITIENFKQRFTKDAHGLIIDEPYRDEFADELMWTDPMGCGEGVMISNYTSPFDRESTGNSQVFDLMDANIEKEINWFKNKHKKVLSIFKKEFGEGSVEIKWGAIRFYS